MSMVLALVFVGMGLFGQEAEPDNILKTDTMWGSEFFTFPISFAPEIEFIGYEEAVFPRGWSSVESPEFWSYVFAWSIEMDAVQSAKELEGNLKIYFDGLTQGVNKQKDFVVPPTQVKLKKMKGSNSEGSFAGSLVIHDSFTTEAPLTLNVEIDQYQCESTKKSVLIFRFSPREFDHEFWEKLREIGLDGDVCTF